MTLFVLVGTLLAFVVPPLLWSRWHGSKKIVYQGEAQCLATTKTVFDHGKYAFVSVAVPGYGWLLAQISDARARAMSELPMSVPVQVTVTQRIFSKPQVESIAFAGDPAPETPANDFDGMFLSVYYFFFGLVAPYGILKLAMPDSALMQHVGLYVAALGFAAAGFVANYLSKQPLGDISDAKASAFGIPLGKGKKGLLATFALCLVGTTLCFWTPTILILIPGLHCAFALGAAIAILLKLRRSDRVVATKTS